MFGPHAAYIIPSYIVTVLVIGGLVIWSVMTHRARLAELAKLEKQGVQRRARNSENG